MRLHLYVTGRASSRSRAAIATARALAAHTEDCELEITDILVEPDVAEEERVMVTPTLDLHTPVSTRRVVGEIDDLAAASERLGLAVDPDAGIDTGDAIDTDDAIDTGDALETPANDT